MTPGMMNNIILSARHIVDRLGEPKNHNGKRAVGLSMDLRNEPDRRDAGFDKSGYAG